MAEWCERNPTSLETAGDLYRVWRGFARLAGEAPGSQRRFAARLERHGLVRERTGHARIYRGVRLLREGEVAHDVYEARGGGRGFEGAR